MVTGNGIGCNRNIQHKFWLDNWYYNKYKSSFRQVLQEKKNIWICQTYFKSKKSTEQANFISNVRVFHLGSCALFPSLYFGYLPILKFLIKKNKSRKTVRLWLSISWQSVNYNYINKWNTTKNDKKRHCPRTFWTTFVFSDICFIRALYVQHAAWFELCKFLLKRFISLQ